jgi:ribose 5-phosphate isomerase B
MTKELVIGCDNAAVQLKNVIIKVLQEENYVFEDVGVMNESDQTVYPEVARHGHCR